MNLRKDHSNEQTLGSALMRHNVVSLLVVGFVIVMFTSYHC